MVHNQKERLTILITVKDNSPLSLNNAIEKLFSALYFIHTLGYVISAQNGYMDALLTSVTSNKIIFDVLFIMEKELESTTAILHMLHILNDNLTMHLFPLIKMLKRYGISVATESENETVYTLPVKLIWVNRSVITDQPDENTINCVTFDYLRPSNVDKSNMVSDKNKKSRSNAIKSVIGLGMSTIISADNNRPDVSLKGVYEMLEKLNNNQTIMNDNIITLNVNVEKLTIILSKFFEKEDNDHHKKQSK